MAFKGTAGKSSSGASMSKYDVEVEARLQALEKIAHEQSASGSASIDDDLKQKIETIWSWYKENA